MKHTYAFIISLITAIFATSCIEDGYTTSPSDQPVFSVDTLAMGTVYTDEFTATHRFTVYNRYSKGLNVQRIALSGEGADLFRLNVDGLGGRDFSNVEIRANDSIFVFLDANLPENGETVPVRIKAKVDFTVNGVTSSVVVTADGRDIRRLKGKVVTADETFTAGKPYQVKDSLVVEEGARLTLEPGTRLLFHDGAKLIVRGTLISNGSAEAPVYLTGDRTGNVITDVSFELMSRQWDGVVFHPSSTGNFLQFTEISNTCNGVQLYGDDSGTEKNLTLHNCRLRNSGDCVLVAVGASVEALGCEFAEAASSLVYLAGGDHRFDQCTLSNHYLFAAISGAAWTFPKVEDIDEYAGMKPTRARITNTITWGLGADVNPGDLTGYEVYFVHCLFKSAGTDDENFVDIIWDTDPMFYTVRNEYLFDYRLKPDSPAIGAAYTGLSEKKLETDFYGVPRKADLGAYVYTEMEN